MPAPFTTPVAVSVPFEPNRNPQYGGNPGPSGLNSTDVQSAIEETKSFAANITRFTLTLLNNGTLSNGQRFTYSELLPNTQVILPRACVLKELTFANSSANADWSFEVRRYTAASGYTSFTSLFTWTGTNTRVAFRSDRNDAFSAGDEIRIIFTDTGDNPRDSSMVLFFQNT